MLAHKECISLTSFLQETVQSTDVRRISCDRPPQTIERPKEPMRTLEHKDCFERALLNI